jgi:hypothetical protein
LLNRSIRIHIYSETGTSKCSTAVHIQITHGSWLIYNTYTVTATYLLQTPTKYQQYCVQCKYCYCFNASASSYTSVVLKLQNDFSNFSKTEM